MAIPVLFGLICVGLAFAAPPAGAAGGSYIVRTTGDAADRSPGDGICRSTSNTCTLRAALTEANLDHGPSSISFAIAGTGTHTINITTKLPTLIDVAGGTTIDGYTQPGSSVNTDPLVDNAQLRIQIHGTGSSGPDALDIASANNVVRGIAFYNLRLAVNMIFGGNHNAIVGNFIGTNAAGTFANTASNANSFGVVIDRLASNNVVGRPGAADRNVISGNSGRGVMLKDAVLDNTIQNNIIGLSPNGQARLPNADHGVDVNSGATRTLVGGTGFQQGNLVSGNDGHGVEVSHVGLVPTANNQIIGNRIGTDPTGNSGPAYARNGDRFSHENVHTEDHVVDTVIADNIIGNSRLGGIKVDNASARTVIRDNRIGVSANGTPISNGVYGVQIELGSHGTVVGPNNIIANNRTGIRLQGNTTEDNTITRNAIFSNSQLGIDIAPLDVVNGATVSTPTNGGIHFPILAGATSRSVGGQACSGCRVELFVADGTTTSASLLSSFGEGRTFLGATTATGGGFTISFPSSSHSRLVTATATDSAGNTSEFSRNIAIPASTTAPPPSLPFNSWDAFVARQLLDFRGAPGTVASRAAAVSQLTSGSVTPSGFIAQLMRQPYFGQNVAPVGRLYLAYFGRVPDYHGVTYWAARHRAGTPLISISQTFFGSDEFSRVEGSLSDPQFVRFIYESALSRAPDLRGLDYWVRRLKAGTPRGIVVTLFSESGECRTILGPEINVVMAFAGMLHRAPTAAEVSTWTPQPVTALIDSIRLSNEYANRVG